jgi:hypothetical protein
MSRQIRGRIATNERRDGSWLRGCVRAEVSAATGVGIRVAMAVYLALGDSISIDDYTGVTGGGAPSQLARMLGAELVDLTRDGNTTDGVLADLGRLPGAADVVTLTAGGNDLLGASLPRGILRRLEQIVDRIEPLGTRVIVNTVYDPSDGEDDVGRRELGLSRLAALELRRRLNALNRGIRRLTAARGLLLADLERLFHGHGIASTEPWFVQVIEPNLAGATAIAGHWHELLTAPQEPGDDGGVARSTDGVVAGEA